MATAISSELETAPVKKESFFGSLIKNIRTSALFRSTLIYNIENQRRRFTQGVSGGRYLDSKERKYALLDYIKFGGDLSLLENKKGKNVLADILDSDIDTGFTDSKTREIVNAYKKQGLLNANLIKNPDNSYSTIGDYIGDKLNGSIEDLRRTMEIEQGFKILDNLIESGVKIHSFVGAKLIKNLTNLNKKSENLLPDSASKIYDSLLENKKTLESYCLNFKKDTAVLDYEYKKFITNYNKNEFNKKNLDNIKYLLNNNMGCKLGYLEATFEIAKEYPNNKELNSLLSTLKEKRPDLVAHFEEKNKEKEKKPLKESDYLKNIVKDFDAKNIDQTQKVSAVEILAKSTSLKESDENKNSQIEDEYKLTQNVESKPQSKSNVKKAR